MKVLVGSQAARYWFEDFREPKDTDYFSTERIPGAETFYHPDLDKWDWGPIATPDELYTIKVSHIFWSNRFPKHIQDIAWFQREKCAVLIPELQTLLYDIWTEHYGAKRAKLRRGTTAQQFFTSTVARKYEHDSVHDTVKYYERPLFNEILRDGEAVAVDYAKFAMLPQEKKLRLAREECYATALERIIIPSDYVENPLRAYRWALEKTMTSFTKGWFPLFMALNACDLLRPEVDYVQLHLDNAHLLIPMED